MERPTYDELITRQNDIYAMDVIERFSSQQKTAAGLLAAVTEAFILGAGGYDGDFDAAITLESGGLAILLESLGLSDIDKNMSAEVPASTFEAAVRASVDFGASWDTLEAEIPEGAIAGTDITGDYPFNSPLARRFHIPLDGSERPDWRED
ncbi:MAG: hypothetical protein JWM81_358 [Candidatus Saccharibacteria bacterium]|nr:hypothetical protein [Candidatus Saccharibacteria bacterium]